MNSLSSFRLIFITLVLSALSFTANAQQQLRGTITGRVVADDGTPLSSTTVMLYPITSNAIGNSYKTALTDEEGNFRFTGLPQRPYVINVTEARGYVQPSRLLNSPVQTYRIGDNAMIRLTRGGVITGRVTQANGEPMISVYVSAIRIRDSEGAPVRNQVNYRLRMTDDRGVYRIYGLPSGSYLVAINSTGASLYGNQSPYDGDAPTYYPSTTRDTATEVQVTAGVETSGIDIRHRSEPGHVISGKVSGGSELSVGAARYLSNISLMTYPAGMQVGVTVSRPGDTNNGFSFVGLPDGEYELIAERGSPAGESSLRSESRRVTVRGGDVTGIELRLSPMASIEGRIVIESTPTACDPKARPSVEELTLTARREEKPNDSPAQLFRYPASHAPNEKGEFKLHSLTAGQHRIETNLPSVTWYIKSVTSAGTSAKSATTDLIRSGVVLKSGEKLSGVTITIADGAAGIHGKIVSAKEGGKLPSRLRVHLVPAEPTAADDVLRYGETLTSDGSFAFANFAPGKYWLLAKPVADSEASDRLPTPVAWESVGRGKLRKEAEATKTELELKPCQRVKDHVLRWGR
ncbi:MAG: carboxypeptidase regulatory-like domain-containing protein [Acidobacteria bacterium]|nr:carboxypeptidase regulatory-like domain-containing protein [Acidobacteriota bacterium]